MINIYVLYLLLMISSNIVCVDSDAVEIYRQPCFSFNARLIHIELIPAKVGFSKSTLEGGRPEQFISVWDCGKFGHVITDNKHVYYNARYEAILLLQAFHGKAIIKDIILDSYKSLLFSDESMDEDTDSEDGEVILKKDS